MWSHRCRWMMYSFISLTASTRHLHLCVGSVRDDPMTPSASTSSQRASISLRTTFVSFRSVTSTPVGRFPGMTGAVSFVRLWISTLVGTWVTTSSTSTGHFWIVLGCVYLVIGFTTLVLWRTSSNPRTPPHLRHWHHDTL